MVDLGPAYTQCAAAEFRLRRLADMTPEERARVLAGWRKSDLADARGCTQPGASHFDSDADYRHARRQR